MPADSPRHVTLADAPPEFDGAALQLCFTVDVDGQPEHCAITAEALEDHFGAPSVLEADLLDAFERGRARIEAACADVLADGKGGVVLHSGYFRAHGRAAASSVKAGMSRSRRS
ncbi:DUF1488 domain-containing protein [Burkholderia pyrrocinia]|uniref:DUF1488 domain-containing protein n=1 Tax=Burkholderia pyrrocinia TaxID=60550 RepID=UPI001588EF65|nr:DUF1488 domain-containing protein [Burkholderia pyrrocinia]